MGSMNIEKIKALTDILCSSGLSAIEVGEGENRIRVERGVSAVPVAVNKPVSSAQTSPTVESTDVKAESDFEPIVSNASDSLIEVKSPLVGVYYAAPSPDAETFVSIGSKVKKGDVLCIIETMKLMNEVLAEHDGEIVDICVKNGDIAEFGQVLFKLR